MTETQRSTAASQLAVRAVLLKRQIAELEEKTKNLKADLDTILRRIPHVFLSEEVDSMKVLDGVTVYKRRQVWASKKGSTSTDEYLSALKWAGLKDFIFDGYSHGQIQAHIREVEEQMQADGFVGDWTKALREKVGASLFDLMNVTDQTKGVIVGS